MANDTQTLKVVVVGDAKSATDALKKLGTGLAEADSKASKSGSAFGSLTKTIAGLGLGYVAINAVTSGVSSAFGYAENAVIGFNSEVQNSTIAFTTMLGSGQKAQTFLNQLKDFAKSTPFEFSDLVSNAQQMMGMGIAAKDVIPDLRALGDSVASVGGSAEQVDQVTLAFDQMMAKGTVDMGNMNQLLQGGVPNALRIMAASYKVTTGKMIEMISTGKVQSSVALPALIKGIEQGTKSTAALGGMMDKQSTTFTGALSNIEDGLTQALANGFKPFFDQASSGAQHLATFLSSDTFSNFGARVSGALTAVISVIKYIVGYVTGSGSNAMEGFSTGTQKRVESIASTFTRVFSVVRTVLGNVASFITTTVVPVAEILGRTFGPLLGQAFGIGLGVIQSLSGLLGPLGTTLRAIFGFVDQHKTTFQALAVGIAAVVLWQKAMALQTKVITALTKGWAAVQAILDAEMFANPIGLVVLAIIGLAAAFAYLWTHSAAFREFWIGLWSGIKAVAFAVVNWFTGPFVGFFVNIWNSIYNGFLLPVGRFFRDTFNGVSDFLKKWWPLLLLIFLPPIAALIAIWNHFHSQIIGAAIATWNAVLAFLSTLWGAIKVAAGVAWTAIRYAVINPIEMAYSAVARVAGAIRDALTGPLRTMQNAVSGILNAVRNAIVNALNDAYRAVAGIGSRFASIGSAIVMGIVHGVEGAGGALVSKLKDLASSALKGAKAFLGIHSPSKVFADEVGKWIPHGIAAGISGNSGVAVNAVSGLATDVVAAGHNSLASSSLGATNGGNVTVVVNVAGHVTAEHDLADTITKRVRDNIVRIGKRNGGKTGL